MSWVRIHDGAMSHPKLVGLSDKAFRLWIWGLSYCQQYLTDGRIVAVAIPPRLQRAVPDLTTARLWDVAGVNYLVHDYLDWNDSRELVQKRRSEAKDRMQGNRDRRHSERRSLDAFARTTLTNEFVGSYLGSSGSSGSSEGMQGEPPLDPLLLRAGAFVERYVELYAHYRNGAKWFRRKPVLEFEAAKRLVGAWDDARLEKLVGVFLKSDDDWISRTDRGLLIFESKASWCDDRLRQWESTKQSA